MPLLQHIPTDHFEDHCQTCLLMRAASTLTSALVSLHLAGADVRTLPFPGSQESLLSRQSSVRSEHCRLVTSPSVFSDSSIPSHSQVRYS